MKRLFCIMLATALLVCATGVTASAGDTLVDVRCDEQRYSTKMPAGLSTTWQEGNGLRIWGGEPGYVPNVLIWRRSTRLSDPAAYISKTYTNHMKDTYGDSLVGIALHEYYPAGGKQLPGASYIYKAASGATINQIHLVEVREDGDVEYDARFLNDERDATLAILDAAVRYYQPNGALQPTATPAPNIPKISVTPASVTVPALRDYVDSRFSMKLPQGWKIMTQGEHMSFCFKAWDPASPNRSVFMFMKLEPFLKSQDARRTYQRVDESLGGNSMYQLFANAPVMETRTLQGFLNSLPEAIAFCEKYYPSGLTIDPDVLPRLLNVEVLEKTPSPLPAPAECQENVIARITFENGQPCEGLITAQPLESLYYDFYGVDGAPCTVRMFMGFTAPVSEMQALEPVLSECLGSFAFNQSYVNQAVGISNDETKALLAQASAMQAAHDAMVDAWYARETAHDITLQKWSDSFMGYERLYDNVTGEVYLADAGFYFTYRLHRGLYSNDHLQIVDENTEQYYLQPADYYITK